MGYIQNIFKSSKGKRSTLRLSLKKLLGFSPITIDFYERALTHRSANIKDSCGNAFNYERLEYVGDAILGAIIAHYLYNTVANADEGYLTKMRSKIVSRDYLNKIGQELELMLLMKSNLDNNKFSQNTYGNLLEALVGAVFVDKGYKACEAFVYDKIINPHVNLSLLEGKIISYKSLIVEWCQKEKKKFNFSYEDDHGVEEFKHFAVILEIEGKILAKARATSRKKAEEKACQRAYFALQDKI